MALILPAFLVGSAGPRPRQLLAVPEDGEARHRAECLLHVLRIRLLLWARGQRDPRGRHRQVSGEAPRPPVISFALRSVVDEGKSIGTPAMQVTETGAGEHERKTEWGSEGGLEEPGLAHHAVSPAQSAGNVVGSQGGRGLLSAPQCLGL